MKTVVLTTERAARQLKRLGKVDQATRRLLTSDLEALETDPPPANLDITPLTGHPPWCRLRHGDWRVVLFPVGRDELKEAGWDADRGYVVYLVLNKKDFKRAARELPRSASVPRL